MTRKHWDGYFDAVRRQQWDSAKKALREVIAEEGDDPRNFLRLGDVCQ